ncbi:MAG: hypothetical protein WC942_09995 [Clostridia bacterium]|jgi:hypothetical protein
MFYFKISKKMINRFIVLIFLSFIIGCNSSSTKDPDFTQVSNGLKSAIELTSKTIKELESSSFDKNNTLITTRKVKDVLIDTDKQVFSLEKKHIEIKEDIKKIQEENIKLKDTSQKFRYIIYGSSLLVIASIFLAFIKQYQLAIYLGATAIISIVLFATLIKFLNILMLIAFILIIIALVLGIIYLIFKYLRYRKGLTEVVTTTEIAKTIMTDSQKECIFSDEGMANKIQNDNTKGIVKTIKPSVQTAVKNIMESLPKLPVVVEKEKK